MADVVDRATRSRMMSGISGKNTSPELKVRRGLHRAGFRYRLHDRRLPGRPDLVLPKYRVAVFVNGCFWHGHDCHLFRWPSTRPEFWRNKIERNRAVDSRALWILREQGWRVLVVWECSLKGRFRREESNVIERAARFMRGNREFLEIRGYDPGEN